MARHTDKEPSHPLLPPRGFHGPEVEETSFPACFFPGRAARGPVCGWGLCLWLKSRRNRDLRHSSLPWPLPVLGSPPTCRGPCEMSPCPWSPAPSPQSPAETTVPESLIFSTGGFNKALSLSQSLGLSQARKASQSSCLRSELFGAGEEVCLGRGSGEHWHGHNL